MRRQGKKAWLSRLGWILLFMAVWQIVVWSGTVSGLLLPGIPEVMRSLYGSLSEGRLLVQIGFSLGIVAFGVFIATLVALIFASLSLSSRIFESLADTLCMLAHPLPAVAVLPLIIIWFGVGVGAVVMIIVHSVLWPLLVNLLSGFRGVSRTHIATGRSLGLSPVKLLFFVYLPASAAFLLSGLKIGWARAWRALISAEMIFGAVGGSGGIGWFMFKSRVMMDTPGLFAGIIVVIIIGMVMEALLNALERETILRWGLK